MGGKVTIRLAISPCPNDTFMFDALVNRRIDTRGLEFDVTYLDIEQLNAGVLARASGADFSGAADVSKISYAVLPLVADRYEVLDSGSALGFGNGPLLVSRSPLSTFNFQLSTIAIPGEHTTANLLMQRLFPELTDRRPMLFSEIAGAVARGEVDAGVLIHEGRFTYRDHGLELVADLGERWETETGGLPLPLGAIVASRTLPDEVRRTVEQVLRASVEYAFAHPAASREYVKGHAQELDDAVIDSHIALFVNENSLSLSPAARRAIRLLTGISAA